MTDAELIALYRDIFAEITAKAIPVCDPTSDDPERVRHYTVPVGPIHRAAGKLGFQMFNGEAHLKAAVTRIHQLEGIPRTDPNPIEFDAKEFGLTLKDDSPRDPVKPPSGKTFFMD